MRSLLALAGLGLLLASPAALAQATPEPAPPVAEAPRPPTPPQNFRSAEEGFAALAAAIAAHDERALLRILGESAQRLIRSGDPVADRAARERFAASYAARNSITLPTPDRAELQTGADDWPFPIPMVRRGAQWRFDARLGGQAILDRRIGRNELDTIETLRAIADAQVEYARTVGRQGAFRAYARRFFSTAGQRDGLYWPSAAGEAPSPLGPLVAAASLGGYARSADGTPTPVHGYLFRILEAQGPAAPGGARSFLVNGRMIGGFAVLAIPAQHGNSGIMSFMISHDGVVWQRDLGPQTARIARGITAFDPGEGWVALPD